MTATRRRGEPRRVRRRQPSLRGRPLLFNEGTHRRMGDKLGAHLRPGGGVAFGVWAPNAVAGGRRRGLQLLEPRRRPARAAREAPGSGKGRSAARRSGHVYKFAITTRAGDVLEKADPFARCTESPPRTGSVVWDLAYEWGDGAWMQSRGDRMRPRTPRSRSTRCTWAVGAAIPPTRGGSSGTPRWRSR